MDVELARQYMQYKRDQGLPADQDNCLYFIHFLLEQEQPSNGVMWVCKEASQGIFHHAFQVIDKSAFARKYGILSDGKTIPKYDSIRRLLNNYAFHCDKKIIWYCSQLDDDGMRLFRPKKGYLLLKIKKKGYRTPSVSYMYPGHDEEFWVPSYATPYNSFPMPNMKPNVGALAAPQSHPQRASAVAAMTTLRSPYEPPMLKKPKMVEEAMGDEDAAALLTDLGRSGSPPSSPPQVSPKIRVLEDDDDGEYGQRDEQMDVDASGQVVARANDASMAQSSNKPYVYRPRRTPSQRPELYPSPSASSESVPPPPSAGQNLRASAPQSGQLFSPHPASLDPSSSSPAFFSPHAAASNLSFAWPSSEVYKLYAHAAARPVFAPGLLDKPFSASPAIDPAAYQQAQQLQLLQAQHLYSLAQGNPLAAQALLQQQHMAQLALQQQLQTHAQLQAHAAQQQQQQQQQQQLQASLGASTEQKDDIIIKIPFAVKADPQPSSSTSLPSAESNPPASPSTSSSGPSSSSLDIRAAVDIKEESIDADSGESIDTEDGYLTPTAAKTGSEHLSLSEANAMSKRNKFFYKQLRDHLDYGNTNSAIGFLNDLFFVMDPKLHVGPTNRDGTFEKRVRLHFIEYLELKNVNASGVSLWLCWGTLLDSSKTPIFRRSSQFYRIPGNQSSVLKSHSRAPQDWDVADETSKHLLRALATSIKTELDSKWDNSDIAGARILVDSLKLVLPTSQPLDEKGDFLPAPNNEKAIFQELLENCLNRSPVPSPTSPIAAPSDARTIALRIWSSCGLPRGEEEDSESWTEEPIPLTSELESSLGSALGVTDHAEHLMKIFRIFAAPEGTITFADLVLTLLRFGGVSSIFVKMIDLLSTGAFNGNMSAIATRTFLNDQPDGTFLIRYSHSFPQNFVLCSRVHGTINQINKIFNQPTAGLEIELEGRLCPVSQWSSIIKSVPSLQTAAIAPEFASYKQHGVPLVDLLADRRFRIAPESFAALPASTRSSTNAMDASPSPDPSDTSRPLDGSSSSFLNDTTTEMSHEDSVKMAHHEVDAKLTQERSADVLSYLSKLRSQSRIAPTLFQDWALFVSSTKNKDVTSQLHSLLVAFREDPDVWIAFATEVIPRKLIM